MLSTGILNLAIVLILAPLFEGMARKIRAVIHSRKGPPLIQPYIDLIKLLGKEDLRCTSSLIFRFAPAFALAAFLVVAMLTPVGASAGAWLSGDLVTWFYLLTLGAAAIILMATSSGSPYAESGAAREIMLLLTVEPVVVAAFVTAAIKSGSMRLPDMVVWNIQNGPTVSMVCAGVAFLLALQPTLGKLPFDIAEAESEIVEGALVEQSGPSLALLKLALLIRQLLYTFVIVAIFVPWPVFSAWPLAVLAAIVKVMIVFALATVVESVSPRLRIDQAMGYMGRLLFVALAALVFAMIGV